MKKIFALLLTVVLLCTSIPFVASAATSGTVTVESTEASAGETISVSAVVSNNPGIVSMDLTLTYDQTRLELVSVTNEMFLTIGEQTAEFTLSEHLTDYPQKVILNGGTLPQNVTANGKLLTFTFKVRDDAPLGDAFVALDGTDMMGFDTNQVPYTFVDGTISVVEKKTEITTVDVSIGADIAVNYYVDLKPEHVGAQMKFTMADQEITVDGVEKNGEYVYTFYGFGPHRMLDNVSAELIFAEEVVASEPTFSIRGYCDALLSKSATDLGISEAKYEAMETLIADLLEYGAKSQLYVGYNVSNLANKDVTGQSEYVKLASQIKEIDESTMESELQMTAVGVYFDYSNSFFIEFTAVTLPDRFRILAINDNTGDEVTYTIDDCELIDAATSTYRLVLNPVNVTAYNDLYLIVLQEPRSSTSSSYKDIQTLSYSVASYIYAMQDKTVDGELTPMANLARATYTYSQSAVAFGSAQ